MMFPVAAGMGAAWLYFRESESGVPAESNCSYLAPASTDVLAVLAGAYLSYYGTKNKAPSVAFIGATVLTIHALQWQHHKS
jgi:hypothetical protein